MIDETYNEKHRQDYFAIRAIYTKFDNENGTQEKRTNSMPTFIRMAKGGEQHLTANKLKKDEFERFMFLPNMIQNQSDRVVCVGQAGTGKSYTLDEFVELYRMINPNNRILYFSMNVAEVDKSLTLDNYEIMDMKEFCESLEGIIDDLNEMKKMTLLFKDSLLVFDDIDKLAFNKKYEKMFFSFITVGMADMRKMNVSCYLISHSSRFGHKGITILQEMSKYIIYPKSLQAVNDRIIDAYFGFKTHTKKRLFDTNDRWLCIDAHKKVVIAPSEIYVIPIWKQ